MKVWALIPERQLSQQHYTALLRAALAEPAQAAGAAGPCRCSTARPSLQPLTTTTPVGFYTLLNTSRLQEPVYSFSSLRSLALGLVILMASWAALSTMILRFLEETL